jgi:CO/xanthine dehydrogenase Mo-binding subunit
MMLFMVSDSGEPSIRPVAAAIVNAIFDASDIDGAYWPVPEEIDDAELPDVLD